MSNLLLLSYFFNNLELYVNNRTYNSTLYNTYATSLNITTRDISLLDYVNEIDYVKRIEFNPTMSSESKKAYYTLLALKNGVDRYFIKRESFNSALSASALTSIMKVTSLFNMVPDVKVTVDVKTGCSVNTKVRLQFPDKCPEKHWAVTTTLGIGSALASLEPSGKLAAIVGLATVAIDTGYSIAGETMKCSEDFRDTKATAASSAKCTSVAKTNVWQDDSLSITDRNNFLSFSTQQSLTYGLQEKLEKEKRAASTNLEIASAMTALDYSTVQISQYIPEMMKNYERSLALRYFNSIFEVDRMYVYRNQVSGTEVACIEPGDVFPSSIERAMATSLCTFMIQAWERGSVQTDDVSIVIRPRSWTSTVPPWSNERWDMVRSMFSDVFSEDFILATKPDRSFTKSSSGEGAISPTLMQTKDTYFDLRSGGRVLLSAAMADCKLRGAPTLYLCQLYSNSIASQFISPLNTGSYEGVKYNANIEYWRNSNDSVAMINALSFKLGESDNEPVRRIADSSCFDGVKNWFESDIDCGQGCIPCAENKNCEFEFDCHYTMTCSSSRKCVVLTSSSTTAKPTTAQPTTAKPTTAIPRTTKPTTAKPTTAKPGEPSWESRRRLPR